MGCNDQKYMEVEAGLFMIVQRSPYNEIDDQLLANLGSSRNNWI